MRGVLHAGVTPREARNNYGLSALVQRYDHTANACQKGSFSSDGASVLGFSPYMHIPPYTSDQPPLSRTRSKIWVLHGGVSEEVGHDQSLVYGGMRINGEKPRTEAPSDEKEPFVQAFAV